MPQRPDGRYGEHGIEGEPMNLFKRSLVATAVIVALGGAAAASPPSQFSTMSDLQRLTYNDMKGMAGVRLAGCDAGSPRGGGLFTYKSRDELTALGFTAPDGGVVIAPSDHSGSLAFGGLLREIGDRVTTDMECAASDRKTDDSAKVQATIDAAAALHKMAFIAPNTVFDNIVLDGVKYPGRYDHLSIEFPYALHGTGGLGGIGLIATHNVRLTGTMDQQNSLQPQNEHIADISLLGAINTTLHVNNLNLRGDGLYATDLHGRTGQPTTGIRGDLSCTNRSEDGRNCASFISATDIILQGNSVLVGGIVGGRNEPGGVDLESNMAGQLVRNFKWTGRIKCGPDATACVGSTGAGSYSNITFDIDVECDVNNPKLFCGGFNGISHGTINFRKTVTTPGNHAVTRVIGNYLTGTLSSNGSADGFVFNQGTDNDLTLNVKNYGAVGSTAGAAITFNYGQSNNTFRGSIGNDGSTGQTPAYGIVLVGNVVSINNRFLFDFAGNCPGLSGYRDMGAKYSGTVIAAGSSSCSRALLFGAGAGDISRKAGVTVASRP
jgi:hypothetical protein